MRRKRWSFPCIADNSNKKMLQVDNVYDIVDESEYAERVTKRRDEDWIVDDDGEYVEDGREIFDEEEDHQPRDSRDQKKYKERSKEKAEKARKDKSNIKNMLLNMPKKQSEEVKLEEDAFLGDILGKIKSKSASTGNKKIVKTPVAAPSLERNPFIKKGTGLKKIVTVPKTIAPTSEPVAEAPENEENMNFEDMDFPDQMDFEEEMLESCTEEAPKEEMEAVKEETVSRGFASVPENKMETAGGSWFSSGDTEAQVQVKEVSIDSSVLPTVKNEEGEDVLRMYWIDAYEVVETDFINCNANPLCVRTPTTTPALSGCSGRSGLARLRPGSPAVSRLRTFTGESSWQRGTSSPTSSPGK